MRRFVPTPGDLVDALAVTGLGMLALLGFAATFEGWSYLVVGGTALLVGVLLAFITTALRQPVVVLAAATLVAYFTLGLPLALPVAPIAGESLRTLAASAALSWKQLLTTAPPIPAESPLYVIPLLIGLLTGAVGFATAQRLSRRVRPGSAAALGRAGAAVLAPASALGLVLAMGTNEPAAKLLDGVVFAIGALVWVSARLRRLRPPTRNTTRPVRRAMAGGAVLVAAAGLATLVAPMLPGAQTPRSVLRDYVVPPFQLSAYPSPLVGFRKYTKDANRLWDQELFVVTGLPEGASVRIATLDDYDGTVWGATDEAAFRRVTSRVGPAPQGPATTVEVTIRAAYAASTDVNAWVPEVGAVSRVEFLGDRADELAASLNYNESLSAGIVTVRLREGDHYRLTTSLVNPSLPEEIQPYGRPSLSENAQALLSGKVATWTGAAGGLRARLAALAAYLRTNGAYTNGGEGESHYLPGHGTGRLAAFLQETSPAGDDEQYAAVYALAANYLGVPARVVLGARPDASGIVRGKDVHAWVELQVQDGSWVAVPETEFMPDPNKRPNQQPPQTFSDREAAIVPPPNTGRLPKTPTDTSQVQPFPQAPEPESVWTRLWDVLLVILTWVGPPLLLVVMVASGILGLKRRRRRRRIGKGLPANRYAGAWQELTDRVRDLAAVKPALRTAAISHGATRREHAVALDAAGLLPPATFSTLAAGIDEIVYGVANPKAGDARAFWHEVAALRRQLSAGLSLPRRVRVALSLRSLRAADPTPRRAPRRGPVTGPGVRAKGPLLAGGRTR